TLPPYRNLTLDLANASLPPLPDTSEWNLSQKGWTKYYYNHGGASFSELVPFPIHDGIPEFILVFDVETIGSSIPRYRHSRVFQRVIQTYSLWATTFLWIAPASKANTPLLGLGLGG
ncbi:hypothetical protein F5887DRAFT_963228, partial [Amanita rubescens]